METSESLTTPRLKERIFQTRWGRRVIRMAVLLAIPYLIALVAVFLAQRHLLYFPDKLPLDLSLTIAKRCGFEPWENASGQMIGWKPLCKTNGPHIRVLITHGNAGSAIGRLDYARALN